MQYTTLHGSAVQCSTLHAVLGFISAVNNILLESHDLDLFEQHGKLLIQDLRATTGP